MKGNTTFDLSYAAMTFTTEDFIHDCMDQVRDRQPDPQLWLERARAAMDLWYSLACAGRAPKGAVDVDHRRLMNFIANTTPNRK
ncbi:hypothetical protein [Winslowiella iniecta]|uniref:hypothetical protein n=1 Tax=Winslowiella iniecta TaxID=1560201 RepID=UPI00092D4324|nr:hypothetical protein [Winslowiella iniecta]